MVALLIGVSNKLVSGEEIEIEVYIDDYGIWVAAKNKQRAGEIVQYFGVFLVLCGVKESVRKREGPANVIKLCGWWYNMTTEKIWADEEKRKNTRGRLLLSYMVQKETSKRYESTLGKQYHFAEVIYPAKAFCRRETERLAEHKRLFGEQDLVMELKHDLRDQRWWVKYMMIVESTKMRHVTRNDWRGIPMWTDARTNGSQVGTQYRPALGGYFRGHWYVLEMTKFEQYANRYIDSELGWDKEMRIPHFEILAIVVALETFSEFIEEGMELHIRCDSSHVVGNISRKSSRDLLIMECIRWITMFCVNKKMGIYISRIGTLDNKLPDTLSRLDVKAFKKVCKDWDMPCDQFGIPPKLPLIKEW